MSVISRRVISNPERTTIETWEKITNIICHSSDKAKKEFVLVSNVVGSLLSEEFMKDYPMTVKGTGAQLRVYCLYGEDAITGEDANEDELSWDIVAGNWTVYLPCSSEELSFYEKSLSSLSDNFKVYDFSEGIDKEDYNSNVNKQADFTIDKEAFNNL